MDKDLYNKLFGEPETVSKSPTAYNSILENASKYQIAIFNAFENRIYEIQDNIQPKSMVIEAVAGSGKTSSAVAMTKLIKPWIKKPIFLAFGNRIAAELKYKLEGTGVPASTTHSYWFRQWSNHLRNSTNVRTDVDQYRLNTFINNYLETKKHRNDKELSKLATGSIKLARFGKQYGIVPDGYKGAQGLNPDTEEFWRELIYYYDLDIDDPFQAISVVRKALINSLDHNHILDFEDMLYFPAVCTINDKFIPNEKHDVVIIDESQDLNEIQRFLLHRMLSNNGFIVSIGDGFQCIFGFRGSDINSMTAITTEFNCESFPLSISYRCGHEIIKKAKTFCKKIEAAPNAPNGEVAYLDNIGLNNFQMGDAIICRNNRPIISLAYRLLRHKINAKVIGRDIGQGLIAIIKKNKAKDMNTFMNKLSKWKTRQLDIIEREDPFNERKMEQIEDKYASIMVFVEDGNISNTDELISTIENLFTTVEEEKGNNIVSTNRVNLSTIFKFKGLEANRVFILDKYLINPPWITQDWERIQERNIEFVAITRAKTYLAFINSSKIVDHRDDNN